MDVNWFDREGVWGCRSEGRSTVGRSLGAPRATPREAREQAGPASHHRPVNFHFFCFFFQNKNFLIKVQIKKNKKKCKKFFQFGVLDDL